MINDDLKKLALKLNDVIDETTVMGHGVYSIAYITDKYVYKVAPKQLAKDYQKEAKILQILAKNTELQDEIPQLVFLQEANEQIIEVQTKLKGSHRTEFSSKDYEKLGSFLKQLHGSYSSDEMHEFDDQVYPSLTKYFEDKLQSYKQKLLAEAPAASDLDLIERANASVAKNLDLIAEDKVYCIVHKDLSLDNILFTATGFSGVIDFGAAQLGIPELDFTIILQRFKLTAQERAALFKGYAQPLSLQKIALVGILQSLRFWKGHIQDKEFVKQQKDYIGECLTELSL